MTTQSLDRRAGQTAFKAGLANLLRRQKHSNSPDSLSFKSPLTEPDLDSLFAFIDQRQNFEIRFTVRTSEGEITNSFKGNGYILDENQTLNLNTGVGERPIVIRLKDAISLELKKI